MKKLIYLVLSVLCAISGMPDVSFYDTLENLSDTPAAA